MHMADALVSPAVGGLFWAASGGAIAYCARRLSRSKRDDLVPTMGVLGAFVFAAQMINVAIPGTGSSGHLGGGLLLAILLGPHAALMVMASVLTIQAFFFADGGLLALGCNIVNLGLIPAFIAYPLVYRPLAGGQPNGPRSLVAMVIAAVAGLQLGALAVVAQTWASGIASLPVTPFLLLMLPIHLAIGLMEGLATAAVISFIARARPSALAPDRVPGLAPPSLRPVLMGLAVATVLVGGVLSYWASSLPDGLEWATARVAGEPGMQEVAGPAHDSLAALQNATAILPDYAPPGDASASRAASPVAGAIGGMLTLGLAGLIGFLLRPRPRPQPLGMT